MARKSKTPAAKKALPVKKPAQKPVQQQDDGSDRLIRRASRAASMFFGAIAIWSVAAPIESAVVAMAKVEVESSRKIIQHLEGGIVSALHVAENEQVQKGDLLLEFDQTPTRTMLAAIEAQYADAVARAARLEAELSGQASINLDELPDAARQELHQQFEKSMTVHKSVFETRMRSKAARTDILSNRRHQLKERLSGLELQARATGKQVDVANREHAIIKEANAKGIEPLMSVLERERIAEQLKGQHGALRAEIAQTKEALQAVELEIQQLLSEWEEKAASEYAQAQTIAAELGEQRIAAQDALERTHVRAPRDGRVLGLKVHTLGGVVGSGEEIMSVVPGDDALIIAAQIAPQDIERITPGASARIRFTSLAGARAPEVESKVLSVSADGMTDPDTGAVYFRAVVELPGAAAEKYSGAVFTPGMPAEVYIKSGRQRAIAFILKPLTDSFARTFREE